MASMILKEMSQLVVRGVRQNAGSFCVFKLPAFLRSKKTKAHLIWIFSIKQMVSSGLHFFGFGSASTLHQRLLVKYQIS